MKLIYKNRKFILEGDPTACGRLLKFGDSWRYNTQTGYFTEEKKAAKEFWHLADEGAEKILNRCFVKRYSMPLRYLPSFLDSHQKEGVVWALTRSRSYLAHAPGAGKTCEAIIASLWAEGEGRTLFIVPPTLTANWEREIRHWWGRQGYTHWPAISVVPESKNQDFMGWKADFVICPDSMLAKSWVLDGIAEMGRKKFVAVDEASRFKESTTERSKALFGGTLKDGRKTPGLIYNAKHVVLLDGSPMPNRPMELWAPLYAMTPETIDFASQEEFGFKYCGASINKFGRWEFKHESNGEELRTRLKQSFMHVVTEAQLNHPERRRTLLYMTKDARSPEHREWEKRNLGKLKFEDLSEKDNKGELAKFRCELGLRKVPWITKYVTERLRTKDESLLLFVWHREVVEKLVSALKEFKPFFIYGGTTDAYREHAFERFQLGKVKLLIGNIASMGRGHNLQRADRIIFGEYSWTDETNKQCEKRASRKGSIKSFVRCEYIVSPDSMDELILKSIMRKAESVKKVIG